MAARLDHLVVAAASLEQGAAWCEATLGVVAGPGGEHPRMGTHNRLLRIATVDYPQVYLEIIAVQPGRAPTLGRRWFDLDDGDLHATLARDGPRLVAWVARVDDLAAACAVLRAQGLDAGAPEALSRMTPRGLLQWQMALRADGARLGRGTVPQLIAWGDAHPAAALPASGVTLQSFSVHHPQARSIAAAFEALELHGVPVREGPSNLCATLQGPRGMVRLESQGA